VHSLPRKVLWLVVFIVSAVPLAMGATITGTVNGTNGKPFEGAFVEAQNTTTNIMTDVLSHEDGRYEIPNLAEGNYRVSIRAVGYRAAAQNETLQTADQHTTCDFALEKGVVSWSDIPVYQAGVLLPNDPGKHTFFHACFGCHNFQSRIANRQLNYQGWLGLVNYMRFDVAAAGETPTGKGAAPFLDNQRADLIANYLSTVFGTNPSIPASPADLPGYPATVTKFSNQAMNIVWVVYPLQGSPYQMPFQMYPPTIEKGFHSDGNIWAAMFGASNRVTRINPVTGKEIRYPVPVNIKGSTYPCKAEAIHAIEVGPDGSAWFAESGCDRIGEVNPKTGKVTQYQAPYAANSIHIAGGYRHDAHPMLVDGKLYVFSSGEPPYRLDPATGKFAPIPGMKHINTYDVYGDPVNGNVWFTDVDANMPLYEVNPKTLKIVTKFQPPSDPKDFRSHRIAFSRKGIVWLTCVGKRLGEALSTRICRINPKTKAFKIYTPLGPIKDDYAIAIDKSGDVWWSMTYLDTVERLDPRTGKIVEYPFAYPEITMRKFWTDAKGRVWWSSNGNANVGYFYLAPSSKNAAN